MGNAPTCPLECPGQQSSDLRRHELPEISDIFFKADSPRGKGKSEARIPMPSRSMEASKSKAVKAATHAQKLVQLARPSTPTRSPAWEDLRKELATQKMIWSSSLPQARNREQYEIAVATISSMFDQALETAEYHEETAAETLQLALQQAAAAGGSCGLVLNKTVTNLATIAVKGAGLSAARQQLAEILDALARGTGVWMYSDEECNHALDACELADQKLVHDIRRVLISK